MLNPEKLAELLALDTVKPREPLRSMVDGEPTGYYESDRDWLCENRFTAVWLLENFADICAALTAAPASAPEPLATHRHKKRGSTYSLIGVGKMQSEHWRNLHEDEVAAFGSLGSEVDMREVAIYRSHDDGSIWVRPLEEFEDGRFELITFDT